MTVVRCFRGLAVFAMLAFAQRSTVDQAWDLLRRDERLQAVTLLREEIRRSPKNAEARLLLGSLLSETGEAAEAIANLREGVRLQPQSALARNALGEALRDAADLKAAQEEFRRAVALDPRMARARENLGAALLESGELAGATTELNEAIRIFGQTKESAYARYVRARVHTASGALAKAAADLQRAVALDPALAEAWSDLGSVREKLSDDGGSLAALQRSVQLNPDGAVARTRLGSLLLRLGKPADAITHLQHAVRLSPDDQTALNSLQRALRETGESAQADEIKARLAEVFRKRDRDSQNALAAVNLNNEGAQLQKQGKLAHAAEKYRAAVELNPGHAGMRVNYAVALLRMGRWEDGLDQLRTAVRQDPSNETFRKALDDALAQAPPQFRGRR